MSAALNESDDGTVFVLMVLDALPEGSKLQLEERTFLVREAQQSVLDALGPDMQVAYRYKFIPALAGKVNAAALDVLDTHSSVRSVFLDARIEGHLAESVPFINADQVHANLGVTGAGITVAVLDSGINANHLDLSDNIAAGAYHFLDAGVTTGPGAPDVNGHGSNVAGIITSGGVVNPVGVAPDCDILAVKVLKDTDGVAGGGTTGWVSDWAAGVDYVVEHKNDYDNLSAINMSLGTFDTYTACPCDEVDTYTQMMAAATDAAKDCGITLFASSGNNGLCAVSSPACLHSVVSVGAVYDQDYGRQPESGTYAAFGSGWPACYDDPAVPDMMCCFSNHHFCQDLLDLLAPGRLITSAWCGANNSWSTYTGTSQACPHCTAVAALMAEVRGAAPPLRPDEVQTIMRDTGVSVGITGECGFPLFKRRIDAWAAVNAAVPPETGCFEFICNGDFEDPPGFIDAGTSDPHDQGQDSLPGGCWRRYETFTGGVDEASAILADTLDNGPSQPGDQCPRFWRFFDNGSGDWTVIIQDVRIEADAFNALTLRLDVKVSNHNLDAGGLVTPAFEWPAVLEIRYIADDDSTQIWRHGWYIDPPGDGIRVVDPGSGLIAEYEDTLVQVNTWHTATFDLLAELPQVREIRQIRVGGSGWDYQSRFDNVSLTGCRCVCGDIDASGGLVDLNDFATFALCFGLGGPGGDCDAQGFACSDLDGTGTVDLNDFATFAVLYGITSSNMVPDCFYEPVCGDGQIDEGEECDDGGESAVCDADCTVAECGDGTVNVTAGEECDEGGESATCDADCTVAECGDGTINVTAGEECDDGGESVVCDTDCTVAECGDGTHNPTAGEECDDGGESATCDADCTVAECGDGTVNVTAGEECDDGGESAVCDSDCTVAECGDGTLNVTAGEECDDGGESATCDADCTVAECGDGTVNVTAGEECDDGGESVTCDDDCTGVICGDGNINETAGEECDDGNTDDGDGCSSDCTVELADCTITFEVTCPNVVPECGAYFGGAGDCFSVGGGCNHTPPNVYQLEEGPPLVINLEGDLDSLSVFFTGFFGSTGMMEFFDAEGLPVDSPLYTNGDCVLEAPPTQYVSFSRPVRSIQVSVTSGPHVYIDTFHVNPPPS